MKTIKIILIMGVFTAFGFGCNIEKKDSGEMPDMEVKAEKGKLPKYDIDWADVDVGERTRTIKVPKVVVVMEEKEIEVPYIDVKMPNEKDKSEERTIEVEVDVMDTMHDVDIEKVYALGKRLIVVAELENEETPLEQNKVRVSDRIVINAPEDLRVTNYILGKRPKGDFHTSNHYIDSERDIAQLVRDAKLIYEG